jgi:hypothetical protein
MPETCQVTNTVSKIHWNLICRAASFSSSATNEREGADHADIKETALGRESENGFHASARRAVYEECSNDRAEFSLQESFAKRTRIGHENADLFYQSGWTWTDAGKARGIAEGEGFAFGSHQAEKISVLRLRRTLSLPATRSLLPTTANLGLLLLHGRFDTGRVTERQKRNL